VRREGEDEKREKRRKIEEKMPLFLCACAWSIGMSVGKKTVAKKSGGKKKRERQK